MEELREILNEDYTEKIYAHKPPENLYNKEKESLEGHMKNTISYYDKISSNLGLREVLKDLLRKLRVDEENLDIFLDFIRSVIYYHDIGKVTPNFQEEKMDNGCFKKEINSENLDSAHSLYGMFLFNFLFMGDYVKNLSKEKKEDQIKDVKLFLFISTVISRHHTLLKDINSIKKEIYERKNTEEEIWEIIQIREKFFKKKGNYLFYNTEELPELYDFSGLLGKLDEEGKEALFYLYKLIYSLLIISDYYATMRFLQGKDFVPDIKTIDEKLKNKIFKNFLNYDFNKKLKNKNYVGSIEKKNAGDVYDFNDLRTKILLEADENIRKALEKDSERKVFNLNVPTGGGKTNISMKLALSILKKRPEIRRIFYVFPFINIIEQNYKVIKKTFGLDENEISPVYSTSSWKVKSNDEKEEMKYTLDNDFLNYPFTVMSNVNFFNSFIKAGKNPNYKLHNLANSIVILDEIQSLNDKDWTLFNDFIEFASKNFNIYFIIMSATLPKLDNISSKMRGNNSEYTKDLIENPVNYHNHFLFSGRVEFEYDDKINDLNKVKEDLDKNLRKKSKILIVFNTIKKSSEFYEKITNDEGEYEGFEVLLLNSTLLQSRRKEIIRKLENSQKNGEKIILISTQSIEAGVDVDCDYGLRELAIFDSIEQVAGRINRNGNGKGKLKIFKLEGIDKSVYKGSFRSKTVENYEKLGGIKKFLKNRDFSLSKDSYYNRVIDLINKENKSSIKEAPIDKVGLVRNLKYSSLDQEDVINQNSISIFIGEDINMSEFTETEMKFMKNLGLNVSGYKISGKDFWKKYKEFSTNKNFDFINLKINSRKLASIISKFTISLSVSNFYNLENYFDEEFRGIFYLNPSLKVYSYDTGLKDPKMISTII